MLSNLSYYALLILVSLPMLGMDNFDLLKQYLSDIVAGKEISKQFSVKIINKTNTKINVEASGKETIVDEKNESKNITVLKKEFTINPGDTFDVNMPWDAFDVIVTGPGIKKQLWDGVTNPWIIQNKS